MIASSFAWSSVIFVRPYPRPPKCKHTHGRTVIVFYNHDVSPLERWLFYCHQEMCSKTLLHTKAMSEMYTPIVGLTIVSIREKLNKSGEDATSLGVSCN